MALPSQIGYYRQHMDAFDMAEVNPSGVVIRFDSEAKAIRWRQLAYTARKLYVERTGEENKWAGIKISLEKDADGARLIIRHEAADAIEVIPLDGIIPERSSLDDHLATFQVPDTFAPEPYIRPLGRTTIKPSPLTDEELGEIEIGGPGPITGDLLE